MSIMTSPLLFDDPQPRPARPATTAATPSGESLKTEALDLLAEHREKLVLRGRRALLKKLLADGHATADDVRDSVDLPADMDPRLFGCVPVALARLGIIAPAGFTKSCRPCRHASILQVWSLADRQAAVLWLAMNPDTMADTSDRGDQL